MYLPFRYRLSIAERGFWIMLALLLALAVSGHAQSRPLKRSAHAAAGAHPRRAGVHPARADADDEFVHNHGTGLRMGFERAALRRKGFPAVQEVGAYHQHRLGEVGSVQVEALYFRQPATATAAATRGLRVPVLLVLNPWDNVSFHLGPQLRWQTVAASPAEAAPRSAPPVVTEFVFGAEARVLRGRIGGRYALPIGLLADFPALGDHFGAAWRAGQLQVYLGLDVFKW